MRQIQLCAARKRSQYRCRQKVRRRSDGLGRPEETDGDEEAALDVGCRSEATFGVEEDGADRVHGVDARRVGDVERGRLGDLEQAGKGRVEGRARRGEDGEEEAEDDEGEGGRAASDRDARRDDVLEVLLRAHARYQHRAPE